MKKAITILVIIGAFYFASEFDKEVRLIECAQETEGTDAECEECYLKVYGHHSND